MGDHRSSDPRVTVAVCTRGRETALRRCVASLLALDPAPAEVLVVDNHDEPVVADQLRADTLVAAHLRVVHEPRRGLDRARDRAMREATGDVVAFTDDDCEVDPAWAATMGAAFVDPSVGLATGRVLAADLAPGPPQWFEDRFSFDRGPVARRYVPREAALQGVATYPWQLGTGCNMAVRRQAYLHTAGFDPLLDMGTRIGGGGDLDLFAQVLDAGITVAYEPDAVVRHHHRRRRREAIRQFHGYGRTVGALLVKYVLRRDGHRRGMVLFATRYVRDTVKLLVQLGPTPAPRWLLLAELTGIAIGGPCYLFGSRGRRS